MLFNGIKNNSKSQPQQTRRKEIFRQWLRIALGLLVFAFGVHLTIYANIGLAPWDCLGMGVALQTPLNYGLAMTTIAVTVLIVDLLLKERIGYGTVIDAQTVPLGGSAVAPPDPEREGWTFIGWDVDFTNVTCDLTVTAQYEQNGSQPALPGDVDCSGAVNVVDALIALRYSMGMVTLDEQGMLNGDMNGDGTVSATDAVMILRLAMGRMPAA